MTKQGINSPTDVEQHSSGSIDKVNVQINPRYNVRKNLTGAQPESRFALLN
jgi:hypothetical protein